MMLCILYIELHGYGDGHRLVFDPDIGLAGHQALSGHRQGRQKCCATWLGRRYTSKFGLSTEPQVNIRGQMRHVSTVAIICLEDEQSMYS